MEKPPAPNVKQNTQNIYAKVNTFRGLFQSRFSRIFNLQKILGTEYYFPSLNQLLMPFRHFVPAENKRHSEFLHDLAERLKSLTNENPTFSSELNQNPDHT